jgi:hypothetical protein
MLHGKYVILKSILGEVLISVTVRTVVFWIVTPRSSEISRRFGGTYHRDLQGLRVSPTGKMMKL